jgi:hypothetical protein
MTSASPPQQPRQHLHPAGFRPHAVSLIRVVVPAFSRSRVASRQPPPLPPPAPAQRQGARRLPRWRASGPWGIPRPQATVPTAQRQRRRGGCQEGGCPRATRGPPRSRPCAGAQPPPRAHACGPAQGRVKVGTGWRDGLRWAYPARLPGIKHGIRHGMGGRLARIPRAAHTK